MLAPPQEPTVVPIESLFYAGEEGIIQRGTAPRSLVATSMSAAAVVSRGEHLCQAADEIAEATAASQRDLRLHLLLADLRTLASGLPGALELSVDAFALSARSAVSRGAAAREAVRFTGLMREAGTRLRGFTEVTQPTSLAVAFDELITALDLLGTVPIDDESDVVPIESLAPEEPAAAIAPMPVTASAGRESWDLAASYGRFEELMGNQELDAVAVTAPTAEREVEPERELVSAIAEAPESAILVITELVYHGRAALERADAVRREIRALWSTADSANAVQPLVEELLDLVELAIAD
jgi:hypothetical protein